MTNSAGVVGIVFLSFIAFMMFSNNAKNLDSYQQTMYACISQNVKDKRVLVQICSEISTKLSEKLKVDNSKVISFSLDPRNDQITMHGYSPVRECVKGETCYTVPAGIEASEIKPLPENES